MVRIIRRPKNKKKTKERANQGDQSNNQKVKDSSSNWTTLEIDKLKSTYYYPLNNDFQIREIYLSQVKKRVFLFYISPIIDTKKINTSIIEPLTKMQEGDAIIESLPIEKLKIANSLEEAVHGINNGSVLILLEGDPVGHLVNLAKFEGRTIDRAQNESIIKGPKEAFTESLAKNVSLIRKRIRTQYLISEELPINKQGTEFVTIMYLKNIVNEKIVDKVRNKISKLNVDYVLTIEMLEQLIEDRPHSLFPTILYSERPDRAVSFLQEGHVILVSESSSACLILPATFWSFFHSSEDHYLRFIYGNFSRIVRVLGLFITLFTSALYVSVTNFHHEMLPPDLLLAIASTREKVPFPVFIEIAIMEFSFELLREAGLRIPTPLGPTIGIVGALILGQAAVQANIISPIIVIVVALSGLASFTISDISLNYSVRLLRFLFILIAGLMGMFGLTIIFVSFMFYLGSLKSFDVPYLSPMTPKYASSNDTIFRKPLKLEKFRPNFLFPKKVEKQ